ncbi:MAG: hypothetical protein ACXW27_10395 [Allosphingosinicella sp.]
MLAAASFGVALVVAVQWNATTVCADCPAATFDFDNVIRLLTEEGAVAGGLFFLGGLLGLFLERLLKDPDNG